MKERLDVILVNQGYAPSREKAKAILMAGNVYVNGQKEDKAGSQFDESKITIEVRGAQLKYVSRGGLKLEKAMESWDIVLDGKVCMDPLPQDKQTLSIVAFNDKVSADPRVESVILPLRDGLNVIRKL